MTAFMGRVRDVLSGGPAPGFGTAPSRVRPTAGGADAQLGVRALAEQLVSEANAVLGAGGRVELTDDTGPGVLAFTLAYAGRRARVCTRLSGRVALAHLEAPGLPADPVELAGPGELEALLLSLLAPPVPEPTT